MEYKDDGDPVLEGYYNSDPWSFKEWSSLKAQSLKEMKC
jgi:hypothetical protein